MSVTQTSGDRFERERRDELIGLSLARERLGDRHEPTLHPNVHQAIGETHGERPVSRLRVDRHTVDRVDAELAPHEVFDRLLGERERGAPTEQGEVDSTVVESAQQLRG